MTKPISRRDTLKSLGSAGAGALLAPGLNPLSQNPGIQITGKPVQISQTSVSPLTVRLSIVPIENGKPQPVQQDGSLATQTWPAPVARLTSLPKERTVRCGALSVKLSA